MFAKIAELNVKMFEKEIPLSSIERKQFIKKLNAWKNNIDNGELDVAAKFIPPPKKYVRNFAEIELHLLYYLFLARYYSAREDKEEFDKTMEYLEARQPDFDNIHRYYYYRLIATRALKARQYKDALDAFFMAEEVGQPEWADVGYYYNFGYCLSDMNYTNKAIKYFLKAQKLANLVRDHKYEVYIQTFLANNYCKIGQGEEALKIIKKCCILEDEKGSASSNADFVCTTSGEIHYRLGKYDEAIALFKKSHGRLSSESVLYGRCVYYMAAALIDSGRVNEGIACIEQGLEVLVEEIPREYVKIQIVLLEALKHSTTLASQASVEYIETVALPKLLETGQYSEAIHYCQLIRDFFENANDKDLALKYGHKIEEIYKIFINKRMEEL